MSSEENHEPLDTLSDAEGLECKEASNGSSDKVGRRASIKGEEKVVSSGKKSVEDKLSSKMFLYARETICFFLAIAFTALAALHSSPPRISKPPVARPFFNESSLVLDFYKGHLGALVDRVTDADFSFVMYYAPWDAECQAAREELESVARYYHSQLFFAAINCWHPGSECRSRYSKIQSYPVLMIYPSRESGVQYKGIKRAPYMIRFINRFMNPIKRISGDEELMQLLKSYDAVMIGYFQFQGISKTPGYREFHRAALRTLERDPNGEIAFVAVTSRKTVDDHGVTLFPSASLLVWNETLFYPDDKDWLAESLSSWISSVVHRVVTWLQPPGSKSSTLAPYLWDGPVLFLFTPRNPFHAENDNYNLLREIGLQYYDCSDNPQINDVVLRLKRSRVEAAARAFERRERCANLLLEEEEERAQRSAIISRSVPGWSNASCCSDTPTNKCIQVCNDGESTAGAGACSHLDVLFGLPLESSPLKRTCFADNCPPGGSAVDPDELDPRSASSVRKAHEREECRRLLAGYSYQRPVFPRLEDGGGAEVALTDSICKANKTLALVAIDSLHYCHFSEGLGVDVAGLDDKTAVVILDPADESEFVMRDELSRDALAGFINDYTKGHLRRAMRSPKKSTVSEDPACEDDKSKICVRELSTDTFLEAVLNADKDVVVMYHSPYCAFCSAVSYVYLTVAHHLAAMDHLEFARIDGDNNDLPWEYTIGRYPSVLFFPAKRKEDSTLFPWTLPVSVGNLLNFVLANLDEESHVEALVNVCSVGAAGSPTSCLSRTRLLCLDVLQQHLREFRRLRRVRVSRDDTAAKRLADNRRRQLLLKLEHVRQVHLMLGASEDLAKDKATVKALREKFSKLYSKLRNLQRDKLEHYHSAKAAERGEPMEQRSS